MTKIAVTSRSFSRHALLRTELQERYPDGNIDFNDAGKSLKGDELVEFLRGHDKAVIALEEVNDKVLEQLPELKVISKYGVGTDSLNFAAMCRHGVKLGWRGGVNRRSVSELVITLAISLLRHLPQANQEVRDGVWRQHIGRQLSNQTVGIVGCGFIGKDLVKLLSKFGCKLLAHDILDFQDFYEQHGVKALSLEELLHRADVVTLHLPKDVSTRNILSAQRLALLKPDAILINTARGGLVDEIKLKSMLQNGELAAAAMDVFAHEPPEDMELLQLRNFFVTPHIGGSAEEAIIAMGRAAIDGLESNYSVCELVI